ncbi:MAG: IMS domain-containing protein [Phormidium sp.]
MDEESQRQELWKTYKILMVVIIGGAILIIGGQAAWNGIQENLSRSAVQNNSPSPESSPSVNSSSQIPPTANSNSLTKEEAVNVISRYLEAKRRIFAPPYDRQVAANFTTGNYYNNLTKPNGQIDYVQSINAWYEYGKSQVDPTGYFEFIGGQAQIEVRVTQDFSYYEYGKLKNSYKDYSKIYRFTLIPENGIWKIADRQP